MIGPDDERIQPADPRAGEAWSDSLYFNFFSRDGSVGGFTRIGCLPNGGTANAGFVALENGVPFAAMIAMRADMPGGDWDDLEIDGLRYRVTEPLRTCAVDLRSPNGSAHLEYEGLAVPFDYDDCPERLPAEVASRHYEQHCRVRGWIEGQDGRRQVDGFGQRDHSWGLRDWSGVGRWRWIQAIFGEDLAFNVFSVETLGGETVSSGYLHAAGRSTALADVDIDTEYEEDGRSQTAVTVGLRDTAGNRHTVSGDRFAHIPIPMGETTVDEALFHWRFDGDREGYGVYEHLFQA